MTQLDWISGLKNSIIFAQRYHVAAFIRVIERDSLNIQVDFQFLLKMINIFELRKYSIHSFAFDSISDPIIKESLNLLKSYKKPFKKYLNN